MAKKKNQLARSILNFILEEGKMLPMPFETPHAWIRRIKGYDRGYYDTSIYRLKKRGLVQVTKRGDKKFISLTSKGQLQALFTQIKHPTKNKWDGKWRLVMFDIPEQAHAHRDKIRFLLKKMGFKKLQASVFISPYPINRSAIYYLKQTGLMNYIRMLRVDEVDDQKDLLHMFKL